VKNNNNCRDFNTGHQYNVDILTLIEWALHLLGWGHIVAVAHTDCFSL